MAGWEGHAPLCPCCTGARRGPFAALVVLVGMALGTALLLVVRFVAGRVVWRRRGPWDASYRRWAPVVPPQVAVLRPPGVPAPPRTSWGRRPGWQRQVMRLAGLVVVLGVLLAPWLTAAAASGAALALVVEGAVGRVGADPTERFGASVAPDGPEAEWLAEEWSAPAGPARGVGDVGGRGGGGLPGAPLWVPADRVDRPAWPGSAAPRDGADSRYAGGEQRW